MHHLITLAIAMLSLTSCATFVPLEPTSTPLPISEQKAIETAILYCDTGHTQQRGTPYNPQARLVTLQRASELLGVDSTSRPSNLLVWLVTLDGTWELVGGPKPRDTPVGQISPTTTPHLFFACSAIIDATTGQGIEVSSNKPKE